MSKPRKPRNNKEALKNWRANMELEFRKKGLIRTLDDMTDEEVRALEVQYQAPIKRAPKGDDDESDS